MSSTPIDQLEGWTGGGPLAQDSGISPPGGFEGFSF